MELILNHLKNLRYQKGLTVREVAEMCGMSHAAVVMVENGRLSGPDTIARVCAVYGKAGRKLLKELGICGKCKGSGKVKILPRSL